MESGYTLELLDYLDRIPINSKNTSLINEIYIFKEMCNNDDLEHYDISKLRSELKKYIFNHKEYEKINALFDSLEEEHDIPQEKECIIKEIDEEDALYNDYHIVKRKIETLNNYITNLKILLDNTELINDLFQNETPLLFEEYKESVIKRINDEKTYNSEYERIASEGDIIYRNREQELNINKIPFDQVVLYGNIRNKLCSTDQKFIDAKKKFDKSSSTELAREKHYTSNKYGILIFKSNLKLLKEEITKAYEEIDELENKKMDIIHRMDYIVYGRQKVKNKIGG